MQRSLLLVPLVLFLGLSPAALAETATRPVTPAVAATIETTLNTRDRHIRQYAFDGDANTYFASVQNAGPSDHFTLVFDKPVAVQTVSVTTGQPSGADQLDAGVLEVSLDGKTFDRLVPFAKGVACGVVKGRQIRAIRLKPAADLKHPLAIREFTLQAEPAVAVFKYPVEVKVDVTDAPDMKTWADKVARICERAYPMINEELKSEGFKPPAVISMTLKKSYRGVAETGGRRITGSVDYFTRNPEDVGAMVHETVHVVQSYRRGNNPSWLVEGIADYVRFFKFEPGKLGRIPNRAQYNGSYRVSAAFLAYLTEKYDKQIVCKLNKLMREGKYKEEAFKELTGKPVQELGEESAQRGAAEFFLPIA